jgi:hypothetical protein
MSEVLQVNVTPETIVPRRQFTTKFRMPAYTSVTAATAHGKSVGF